MSNYFRGAAAAILLTCLAVAAGAQSKPDPKALAVVNGQSLTEAQIEEFAAGDLRTLELRRLQAERGFEREKQDIYDRTLTMLIGKTLVEAAAKKQGITVEALVVLEVESRVALPSDADVKSYYEANKANLPAWSDDLSKQIWTFLRVQRRDALYDAYVDKLRKESTVQTFFEVPRIAVETKGSPAKGPADAPVTIIEFADFECPFCDQLFPTLKQIETQYGDRIRFIYRQFPLGHPHSEKAALASLCAFEQQKFWEMHDAIFQDAQHMDDNALKQKAAALKLDTASFDKCLESSKYVDTINRDLQDGSNAGVAGTPVLFINGRYLAGAAPYDALKKIIDEELQKKR